MKQGIAVVMTMALMLCSAAPPSSAQRAGIPPPSARPATLERPGARHKRLAHFAVVHRADDPPSIRHSPTSPRSSTLKRHARRSGAATRAASASLFALTGNVSLNGGVSGKASSSPLFADVEVPVYVWAKPNVSPRAIIIGLHGGAMHGRALHTVAKKLSDKDYIFVSTDMRGYGVFFDGPRRNRKLNFKKSVSDVYEIIDRIKTVYPSTPIVCLGESLGGNMGLYIAGDSPERIDGVIAISPFSSPRFFVYPVMLRDLAQTMINPFSRLNMKPYLERRLTYDRQEALRVLQDPLMRTRASVIELIQASIFNLKGKRVAKHVPAYMPILFLVGEHDRLCSVKGAKRMFAKNPSKNKRLVVLENQGHLIVETDRIRSDVMRAMFAWLDEQKNSQMVAGNRSRRLMTMSGNEPSRTN